MNLLLFTTALVAGALCLTLIVWHCISGSSPISFLWRGPVSYISGYYAGLFAGLFPGASGAGRAGSSPPCIEFSAVPPNAGNAEEYESIYSVVAPRLGAGEELTLKFGFSFMNRMDADDEFYRRVCADVSRLQQSAEELDYRMGVYSADELERIKYITLTKKRGAG